jgi:hypothetical protein
MLMALILSPVAIAIALFKILEPIQYSEGDIRNGIEFRLIVYGAVIAFCAVLMIASWRRLTSSAKRRH